LISGPRLSFRTLPEKLANWPRKHGRMADVLREDSANNHLYEHGAHRGLRDSALLRVGR
jgi:hypothetical protein